MTITPPNVGILPFSVQRIAPAPERKDDGKGTSPDQGFGAVLSALQGEGEVPLMDGQPPERLHDLDRLPSVYQAFEQGVEFESGTLAYTLKVDVGDHALAFQARPIVGPSAIGPEAEQAIAFGDQLSMAAPLTSSQAPAGETVRAALPGALDFEPAFQLRPSDGRIETAAAARRSTVAPVPGLATAPSPARIAETAQPQQGVQRHAESQQRVEQARSLGASRAAQLNPQLQARAQVFAQLVAAATEYRVAVRGAQLSQADHDRLVADIRAALRSHGLADLPITLSTDAGVA